MTLSVRSTRGTTLFLLRIRSGCMDWDSVTSSLLRSVGCDPDQRLLKIELQDGKVYRYTDVPEQTYERVMDADSLGRYFNQHIRGLNYGRVK